MKVFNSSNSAKDFCKKGSAVALGNFDGIHLGHREILKMLKEEAGKRRIPSVVYTFEPHPVKILSPAVAPQLINTFKQKIELLDECGIDAVVVEKFNRPFSHNSSDEFFWKYLLGHLNSQFIIVGYDFTFGSKRQGNIETLQRLCFENRVDVMIMDPFFAKDTLVSSTLIRKYIQERKVKKTIPLLNRPFFIDGEVVSGEKRGKNLGIPTINLKTKNELIPKEGVYATRAMIGPRCHSGVTNIGTNPTFGGKRLSIETYLFKFKKKIYGKKVRLFFLDRIRDEKRFKNPEALTRQVQKDIVHAKKILKHCKL